MVTRSPHGPDTPLLGHVDWSGALRRLANQYGQEVAVNDGHGHNLTYRQLHDYAHAVANVLFRQLELRAGEAVATLLPNTPAAVWASYGVRLGGRLRFRSVIPARSMKWCGAPDWQGFVMY